MLAAILLLAYAFILTWLCGRLFIRILERISGNSLHEATGTLANFVGLAVISVVLALYHFFFPVDIYPHLFIIGILISRPSLLKIHLGELRELIQKSPLTFAALFLIVTISIVARPGTGDIADYHLQGVRWAELYPNVPGLGNFNRPLANNNWWFNLQAFFSFHNLGLRSVYVLNGLLFVSVFHLLIPKGGESGFLKIFMLICASFIALSPKTNFVGSITPDYAVTAISFVCCFLLFKQQEGKNDLLLWLIPLLACFAITIKLNALLLLLPALYAYITLLSGKKSPAVWLIPLIGLVFMLPWLCGNVIVSGWLCYPLSSIDLFNFDWKLPASVLDYERFSIRQWGKVPYQDIYVTAKMSTAEWLPLWISKLDVFNKGLAAGCLIALILLPVSMILRKERNPLILTLLVFSVGGIAFCFSAGPHIRYAYGYILVLIGTTFAYALHTHSLKIPQNIGLFFLLLACISAAPRLSGIIRSPYAGDQLLHPPSYPADPKNEALSILNLGAGQTAFITKTNSRCWDLFPCSYYMVEGCEMRGTEFSDGFRVRR